MVVPCWLASETKIFVIKHVAKGWLGSNFHGIRQWSKHLKRQAFVSLIHLTNSKCYKPQLHYPFMVEISHLSIFCAIRWNDLKVFDNRWSSVINTKSNIVSSSTFYSTQGGMMSPVLVALKVLCLRWSQQTLILVRSSDTYRLQSNEPDHIVWTACCVIWPECD